MIYGVWLNDPIVGLFLPCANKQVARELLDDLLDEMYLMSGRDPATFKLLGKKGARGAAK